MEENKDEKIYQAKSGDISATLKLGSTTSVESGINFATYASVYLAEITFKGDYYPPNEPTTITYNYRTREINKIFFRLFNSIEGIELLLEKDVFPRKLETKKNLLKCIFSLEEKVEKDYKRI